MGDKLTLMDDGHMSAELLHDLEDMGCEEDGHASLEQLGQEFANQLRRDDIDALKGLIEEEHLGVVDQSRSQG